MSDDLIEFIKKEYVPKSTLRYFVKSKEKELQELKELFQIGDFVDNDIGIKVVTIENIISSINEILKC